MSLSRFHFTALFFAAVIYLVTAWHSHGYFHPDEHYQIVEFAGVKLGFDEPKDMAWEYQRSVRSALQPTICYVAFVALNSIHITDPYDQMLVLRLISALFALTAVFFFVRAMLPSVKPENHKLYVLLSYFLWFIPIVNVRFSGECWAGLSFLVALTILHTERIKPSLRYFLVGIALCLSFLFRFQMAFLIIGLILWILFVKKESFKNIFLLTVAGFVVLALSAPLDAWYYGKPVFTPWNYFNAQVVDDIASTFGRDPWFFHLFYIFLYPFFPFGLLLLVALFTLIFYRPRNIFIWCIIPFLVIHSIIPHKEQRFLFPLINLSPIILVLAYEVWGERRSFKEKVWSAGAKYSAFFLLGLMIIFDITGLAAMACKSAGTGRMEITKYIHDEYHGRPVRLLYSSYASPYNPWYILPAHFYQEKNVTEVRIDSLCDLNDSLIKPSSVNLLVIRKAEIKEQRCLQKLNEFHYTKVTQSIPAWVECINYFAKSLNDDYILILYSTDRKAS